MCLLRPSEIFKKVVYCQLQQYKRVVASRWATRDLLDLIRDDLVQVTNEHFPEWFNVEHPCHQHRLDAVKFLMRVKCHATCRSHNQKAFRKRKAVIYYTPRAPRWLENEPKELKHR
ncbi:hypothetical protein QAD02_017163 [Eretmocerus hayati]|uniref:Uncharacterized protein n=1 Tax=Eretmocerus hayati TaxID=131215 RepID=A0ACC2PEC5_9HYME|nr:hypothetical protein QAD02_017163 [Eretmocerus hayati]